MGQWVMGHGSNGSLILDGSRGSWVNVSDPLTHDKMHASWLSFYNKINAAVYSAYCDTVSVIQ